MFDHILGWFDLPLNIFKQFLKIVRKFRGVTNHPKNLGKIFTRVGQKIFSKEVFDWSEIEILILISIIPFQEL